jgi:hypothetical protein
MTTTHSEVSAPEVTGYVLPNRPRQAGGAFVVTSHDAIPASLHRHTGEVAKRIGERVLLLAECQQQFLGELRTGLRELEGGVVDDARIKLQASIRSAITVLDWCDALQQDLLGEGQRAAHGWQPIDLAEFCADVASECGVNGITVVATGELAQPWWGDAGQLAEVLRTGIGVVAERSAGPGAVLVEISGTSDAPRIRVAGTGDPAGEVEEASIRQFRDAVGRLGAKVVPDGLGPGGTGLILQLPGWSLDSDEALR